jgi:hypothetical protein
MKEETQKALHFLTGFNPLEKLDVPKQEYTKMLIEFMELKGEEALQALAGFYLYALDNIKDYNKAIVSTFAHDLGGRNDEWMLPRSDNYLKYWEEELSLGKATK